MRCPSSALPTSKCRRPRSGSGARFKVNHRGTEVTEKKTSKFSVTSVPLWLNRCRRWKEEFMARIKHIALTTKEPAKVADLDEACQKLENAQAQRLTAKDGVDATMAGGGHANFEMKWSGPDGVVIDISHTGWEGTD